MSRSDRIPTTRRSGPTTTSAPIRCLANTLTAVSRLAGGSKVIISPLLAERMVLTVIGRLPGNSPTHLTRGTNKVPAPNFGKILRRSHPALQGPISIGLLGGADFSWLVGILVAGGVYL